MQAVDAVDIEYIYHKHIDSEHNEYADGYVIYDSNEPGGCFITAGHTHNKTGTCPSHTATKTEKVYVGECQCSSSHSEYGGSCGHGDHGAHKCRAALYENRQVSYTAYDCGSPNNTWKLGCGKTKEYLEQAIIKFK